MKVLNISRILKKHASALGVNFITLIFLDKNIEKKFRNEYFKKSLVAFRISFIVLMLLYSAFGYLDYFTSHEFYKGFFVIRYLIILPFLLAVFLFSFNKLFEKVWQGLISVCYFIGGVGIIYMLLKNPDNIFYYGGMFLVFAAGYFFVKLRFFAALIPGISLIIIYNIGSFLYQSVYDIQFDYILSTNAFYISANIISLIALYNIEFLERKDFYQKILLTETKNEITLINQSLEAKVNARTKLLDERNTNLLVEISQRKKVENELLIAKKKAEESEEKFKKAYMQANQFMKILDNLPTYIYIKNTQHQYTYANKICLNLFNKTKETINGSTDEEFFPNETVSQLRNIDTRILKHGKNTKEEVIVKSDKNKTITYLEMKFPLYDEKGKINGLCGISSDISEIKQFQKELQEAKEKAEESDRLKSAFLANMSHEIRTPMNGILGFTDLLKEPKLSGKEQEKYIGIIESSGQRLLNTVNDLIDISKIEAGQMKVSVSDVNLSKLLEQLFAFFNVEAQKKGLQLFLSTTSLSENIILLSDQEKLYSILTNLIKNAIKYTQSGNIDFGYILKKDTEPVEVQFFVKDSGDGISENRLNVIFDRFIRSDLHEDDASEGSGLGLSISKAYVKMLDGKIWAESKEGEGSQFYFTIPYKPLKSKNSENKEADYKIKSKHQIKDLKILIAEDEESGFDLLSVLLKDVSKEILRAKTGVETVEQCRNNQDIDLVLMDIQMPEMNGYEATKQIRKFNKDVIIIAQTAYAISGDKQKSLDAGCDDYISKPINKTELFEKIENCLRKN